MVCEESKVDRMTTIQRHHLKCFPILSPRSTILPRLRGILSQRGITSCKVARVTARPYSNSEKHANMGWVFVFIGSKLASENETKKKCPPLITIRTKCSYFEQQQSKSSVGSLACMTIKDDHQFSNHSRRSLTGARGATSIYDSTFREMPMFNFHVDPAVVLPFPRLGTQLRRVYIPAQQKIIKVLQITASKFPSVGS